MFCVLICFLFSGVLRWKENLAQKAAAAFLQRQQDTPNLQKLVYGNGEIYSGLLYTKQFTHFKINFQITLCRRVILTPVVVLLLVFFYVVLHQNKKEPDVNEDSDDNTVGGIFRLKSKKVSESAGTMHERDCSLEVISTRLRDWSQPEVLEIIRDCFVTGKWKDSEDAEKLLQDDDQSMNCS